MFRKTSTHDAEPRFQEETILNQPVFAELLFTKLICVHPMGGFSDSRHFAGNFGQIALTPLADQYKEDKKDGTCLPSSSERLTNCKCRK